MINFLYIRNKSLAVKRIWANRSQANHPNTQVLFRKVLEQENGQEESQKEEEEEEGGRATAYNRLESRIDLIDWSNRPHKKMAKVHGAKFMNVHQSS